MKITPGWHTVIEVTEEERQRSNEVYRQVIVPGPFLLSEYLTYQSDEEMTQENIPNLADWGLEGYDISKGGEIPLLKMPEVKPIIIENPTFFHGYPPVRVFSFQQEVPELIKEGSHEEKDILEISFKAELASFSQATMEERARYILKLISQLPDVLWQSYFQDFLNLLPEVKRRERSKTNGLETAGSLSWNFGSHIVEIQEYTDVIDRELITASVAFIPDVEFPKTDQITSTG